MTRSNTWLIAVLVAFAGCGDCSDGATVAQFCESSTDCAGDLVCEEDRCVEEPSDWVGEEASNNGSSETTGPAETTGPDDNPDREPPVVGEVTTQPLPDYEESCQVGQSECGDDRCVGKYCVPRCQDEVQCEAGQTCRDGEPSVCFDAWACPPGGGGDGGTSQCRQSWEDCEGNDYSVSCKVIDEADPLSNPEVLCSCLQNGVTTARFEWRGFPCETQSSVETFYNEKCGWALPIPGNR